MANRYDIVHIDFQASARGANAAIESIRKEAEKSSAKLEQMRKDIDNAVKAGKSDETIAQMRSELKAEETRYKQFKAAQNELIKGMRVLDQAVQQFNNGSLGEMNAAFQKAAFNAAKLAQSKMTTGTDEWRQMAAIMQETEQNYSRMQRDTDQLIQTIQSGGTVFVSELEKEKRGLEELMKLVPYMGQEYQKLQGQYTIVTEKLDKMAIAERQAKGEIVTVSDAMRVANQLTAEGAAAAERDRQTAEQTIATSKEKIALLEKERETLEANARASADIVATHTENIRAKEADIAATEKLIKADERSANGKRSAATRFRKEADEKIAALKEEDKGTKEYNDTLDEAEKKRKKANKLDEEANKLADQHKGLLADQKKELEGLNTAAEHDIQLNERNQKALQDTNAKIGEQGQKIRDAEALRAQATTKGIRATEDAIRILEKENAGIDTNSEEWRKRTAIILQLQAALDKMKNQQTLQLMEGRMQNVTNLSNAAVTETKRFWQAMYDGADRNDPKLKEIEANLKRITAEEEKRSRAALEQSAGRLKGNLGNLSSSELRQAIEDGKKLQATYKETSREARELANQILNAEEYAKSHGIEAMRQARKEQEALRQQEEQERELARTMTARLHSLKTLSADATAEARKYWEAQKNGAEEGTAAFRKAELALSLIDKQQAERTRQRQEQLAARLNDPNKFSNYTTAELKESVDAAKLLAQSYKSGSKEAQDLTKNIVAAEEHVSKYSVEAEKAAKKLADARKEMVETLEKAQNGEYATASMQTLDEAIKKLKAYQALIEDPNGLGKNTFDATKTQIEGLTAQLNALKGVTEKTKGAFKDADEVLERFNEHLGEPKIETATQQTEKLAQTLDEKLSAATSEFDEDIKEATEDIAKWEKYVKEAEEELSSLEAQRNKLSEKIRGRSALGRAVFGDSDRKKMSALTEKIEGGEDFMGARDRVESYKTYLQWAKESLEYYKQQKAEALGLNETVEQLSATEEAREEKAKQARRMTREEMAQGIKILEEEAMAQDRSTADGQKKWEQLRSVIDQMNQELKESTGEWMKLADAEKLAETAGSENGFFASPEEIQKATAAIIRQREALIKTIQTKKANGEATTAEEKKLADLTKKLRDLKFEQDNVNVSQGKMRMLMKTPTNAVNLEELRAAIKRADGELRRMEGSLGTNSKKYQEFAKEVKEAKNVLKEMEGQAKATTSAFDKAWSRLKTYVGLYVGAAVAMQKVTATMGDLMELSDKMGEVRKTTGFTADEVGRLTTELKKMDVRTPLVGLLEISASAGQLGLKTLDDIQGFTEAANKLMIALPEMGKEAATELMRVAIATGEVNKIRQQMEEGTVEGSSATAVALEKIASTIDRLRASSASTAPEITDFVKRLGAVGAQSGITVDQVAALGSTVSSLGMRVEMSATALSRMIPAIRNNAYEIGAIIGKTEEDIKRRFAEGQGMSVILDLFRAIRERSGITAKGIENDADGVADKVEKMMEAAGFRDIMKELNQQGARAGIVFAGLSQNVEQLEYQLGVASQAYEENIAIQKEFDRMNETTAAKWERLKNQLEEAFVGDWSQSALGWVIDGLRGLVDFITGRVDGVLAGLRVAFLSVAAGVMAYRIELGKLLLMESYGGLAKLWKLLVSMKDTIVLSTMYTGQYIAMKWKLIWATEAEEKATIRAKIAQLGLNKAMAANVFMAVATAILTAYLVLKDWIGGSKAAANAMSDLNEKVDEEKRKLDVLVNAYHDANGNLDKRKNLMNEINQKYSKYLGFLLTDAENSNLVALAHERIAAALQAEMYERERASGESKVRQDFREDLAENWKEFTDELREYGLTSEQVAQARNDIQGFLQTVSYDEAGQKFVWAEGTKEGIIDYMKNEHRSRNANLNDADAEEIMALWVYQYLETNFGDKLNDKALKDVAGVTMITNSAGKGWDTAKAGSEFRGDYADYYTDMLEQIGKYNDDVNGAVAAANKKMEENREKTIPELQKQANEAVNTIQNNLNATDEEISKAYENLAGAIEGLEKISSELPVIATEEGQTTTSDITSFVTGLFSGNSRVSTQKVTEARARLASLFSRINQENGGIGDGGNGGNGGRGPYGNYDKRVDPYEQWDANALVKRREEMLERVRALAGGADVQTVLSMDKRFMDEATRKGIKNMRDAIAWYNEERLKIQEELHSRNLTNTGDWMDPKQGGSKRKPKTPESEAAIAELDRYYLERKELIEEARSKEEMTEAEYNRRLDALEMEHLQKRSDLRKTFTSDDKQFINQFRQWWASVAELDDVSWETIEAEWQAAWERDRKYNNREAQKDLTQMQAIIVKQLKEIEAIIDKERPFNGITTNLQDNLTKMGLLFKDGVPEGDKFMEENTKRLTFLLREAENAYAMTWEQLEQDMRQNGLGSWADAITDSENADKEKRAIIAQLHEVYDAVQEAIKKEASLVKKQVDIQWNDAILPNGKSIKATYEAAISALGVQQGSVSRANSLIGAGAASERVADRLAIRQMQVQLRMQEHYYNLVRQTGQRRVDDLLRAAEEQRKLNNIAEAEKLELDAKHAQMSLNLSLSKEETELAKQREEIIARTEESQNRLYTELKEWGDLLASSLQSIFEASAAGNEEYYNELAKLNLTGKGGPGAGTYVVIDNAGTSDAKARYEYLDESQALERQHEIEQENAKAEAWKKVMDDINAKLSETITDQLNALFQNASLDVNTQALDSNTDAVTGLTGAVNNLSGTIAAKAAQDAAYRQGGNGQTINGGNMGVDENGVPIALKTPEATEGAQGYGAPWMQPTQTEGTSQPSPLAPPPVDVEAYTSPWAAYAQANTDATKTVMENDKKAVKSSKQSFAAMTAAANMYGIAYQTMSNENLSTSQKVWMMIVQAAGQAMISMLTASLAADTGETASHAPAWISKTLKELGPVGGPVAVGVFTALIGGLMATAVSKIGKSKSEIAQATGSSGASAGKLATGMLTYAEGNVNEFTNPDTLTPGRQYNVDAADGKTYRARYMGSNPKTHITNGPEFHLAGEKGREMIIDAGTTRQITMNEGEIWHTIQTLSNGGRGYSLRRSAGRSGMRAFADGNVEDFSEMLDGEGVENSGMNGISADQMLAFQSSLDRNNELLERALTEGIKGVFDVHGPGGLVNTYDKAKKEAVRHGERYT